MAQGNMTDEEKQALISFYKQNPTLRDNADPNYRNKDKRSLIKVKLVTLFEGKFSEEFLESLVLVFIREELSQRLESQHFKQRTTISENEKQK